MFVSEVIDNVRCKQIQVNSLEEVAELMTQKQICTSVFKDDYRTIDNFLTTKFMMLDIDENCTLDEAKKHFGQYKFAIATTRNHQKDKVMESGIVKPACDRFRVLLELDAPIETADDYYETFAALNSQYPFLDKKCKDPSRLFFPSPSLVDIKPDGGQVKKQKYVPKPAKDKVVSTNRKGILANRTMELIIFGANENFNDQLHFAAKDMQEQGYSQDEASEHLLKVKCNYKKVGQAEYKKTIKSAFSKEAKYEPRGVLQVESAFNFKTIKQLMEEKPTVDWYVENFLAAGAISIIAGRPKSGKSTIIRQLSAITARGGVFLDRQVKQGPVVYLALEEQETMIYDQFNALGVAATDPILFHAGPLIAADGWEYLKQYVMDAKPKLLVIDTLVMFAKILDQNNYKEVYEVITKYRNLARSSGTHIICIHHQNKSEIRGNNSVMGSGAFTGAVDTVIFFDDYNNRRFISSNQRGGVPFVRRELVFNQEKQMYSLGEVSSEF